MELIVNLGELERPAQITNLGFDSVKAGRAWRVGAEILLSIRSQQSRASIRFGRETLIQRCCQPARNWGSVLFPGVRSDKDS
jgi:hypothetical protein